MVILQNILWLLVLIGVMIIIHEAGHFWAARWFDVKVDVFSFGFGPRLFGFRRGDTDYRFSLILFDVAAKQDEGEPVVRIAAAEHEQTKAESEAEDLHADAKITRRPAVDEYV